MPMPEKPPCCCCSSEADSTQQRRGFIAQAVTIGLGALAYLVPLGAGVVAFLNPLRRTGESSDSFIRLTTLDALPTDGTPRKYPIIADRADAWNRYPKEPIGNVFLRRTGSNQVTAFQSICPHIGCSVEYSEANGGRFYCPCHRAHFDLDGKRLDAPSPSPRDLDTLVVDQERLRAGEVWVKFERYKTGTPEKVVLA